MMQAVRYYDRVLSEPGISRASLPGHNTSRTSCSICSKFSVSEIGVRRRQSAQTETAQRRTATEKRTVITFFIPFKGRFVNPYSVILTL